MGLNEALEISVSGVRAETTHMELISSNIANVNTTRSLNGGPYQRRVAVYEEKPLSFAQELQNAELKLSGGGVKVREVSQDQSALQKVYNPAHPDADANGFVKLPNVSLATEMTDMVYVSKLYEANITAYNATKKMMQDTLSIQ